MTSAPSQYGDPVVATSGNDDEEAPLVVLLHGRGSHERDIISLADRLPPEFGYAAVRAPIVEGGGYAWFANRGIGRPVAASLRSTTDWFRGWLDSAVPRERPVVLAGFSGGAAFAGGLILDEPGRFAGAAILSGTMPFDAGMPATPARLAGLPVFLALGARDTVIPAELLARTWAYLTGESGAPTVARRDATGHSITEEQLRNLAGWVRERFLFIKTSGLAPNPAESRSARWPTLPAGALAARVGRRPEVTTSIPQQQVSQNAPATLQEQLFATLAGLPGVTTQQSEVSVPGARGFVLEERRGPESAFLVPSAGEFAHLHPAFDGSMHLALPLVLAADAVAKGWALAHPLAGVRLPPGMVMVYGPRDGDELHTVTEIARSSYLFASGRLRADFATDWRKS
ncbi:hypothetical protein GCM10027360_01610 [Amycolatopsis echigonensis]